MSNKNDIHVLARGVIIDDNHILLCKTLDLPANFYFLPGGHVEHGESVTTALLREVMEEIGAKAYIKRFLGCLEHSFEPGYNSICHNHEYNFIFEIGSDALKAQDSITQKEDHIKPVWIPLSTINEIDIRPKPIPSLLPEWLKMIQSNSFKSVMI